MIILVIVIITVLVADRLGYTLPGVITLLLGTSGTAAQVARALLAPRGREEEAR